MQKGERGGEEKGKRIRVRIVKTRGREGRKIGWRIGERERERRREGR